MGKIEIEKARIIHQKKKKQKDFICNFIVFK